MDIPHYVPEAVCTHITTLIEGNSWEPSGWAAELASADKQISEIAQAINDCNQGKSSEYLDRLRLQKQQVIEHQERLAKSIGCLQRFAQDAQMQVAYNLLNCEFVDDEQWRSFISAAWAALMDYEPYRVRLQEAQELNAEIAVAADKLAKLIHEFEKTGIFGPSEFHSVPDLLRKTDNLESQGHNLHMWRSMRKHVLGDGEVPNSELAGLRYGWEVSPSLPALLETVAKSARDFKPVQNGMVGAVIATRGHNEKTAYLRAFKKLLTDAAQFELTQAVRKAMAIVATVAINQSDIVVTYDDVRKTPTIPDA